MDCRFVFVLTFSVGVLLGLAILPILQLFAKKGGGYGGTLVPPSDSRFQKIVETLTRQSARWALASGQDRHPVLAALHANYAAGYLWALQEIADRKEVAEITGIDLNRLTSEVVAVQDQATKSLVRGHQQQSLTKGLNQFLAHAGGHTVPQTPCFLNCTQIN